MTITEQLEAHKGCMTLAQFAAILGVSYKTVYKWVRTAHLPSTKVTGSYWVDPQLAALWWRNHSTAMPPANIRRRAAQVSDVA